MGSSSSNSEGASGWSAARIAYDKLKQKFRPVQLRSSVDEVRDLINQAKTDEAEAQAHADADAAVVDAMVCKECNDLIDSADDDDEWDSNCGVCSGCGERLPEDAVEEIDSEAYCEECAADVQAEKEAGEPGEDQEGADEEEEDEEEEDQAEPVPKRHKPS